METQTQTQTQTTVPTPKVDFGNGRYSKVAMELYGDCQRLLGMSKSHAEKVARCWMADFGRAMAVAEVDGYSIGKPNKDGIVSLREVVSKVKMHLTYSLSIAKVCVMLQDAKRYGIADYTSIELTPALVEWLNKP